jgi:hypothetical protein
MVHCSERIHKNQQRGVRRYWLMPVILATQEAEIRRIEVRSQPRQIVCETLSWKTLYKNRTGRVAQGEGPEFKTQHRKKKKKGRAQGAKSRPKLPFVFSQWITWTVIDSPSDDVCQHIQGVTKLGSSPELLCPRIHGAGVSHGNSIPVTDLSLDRVKLIQHVPGTGALKSKLGIFWGSEVTS